MFLLPLLLGFTLNAASAFTTVYSRRWGETAGRLVTAILRNALGIPLCAVGLSLAMLAPSRPLIAPHVVLEAIGWLLAGMGSVLIAWALHSLGRRAAVPSLGDTLVTRGPYAHIRHPIYSGMVMELGGIWLLRPSLAVLVACVLGILWLMIQARLEEIDLLQRIPGYDAYAERVPRFVPRLRAGGLHRHGE